MSHIEGSNPPPSFPKPAPTPAPPRADRPYIATLAHATAHEITALREARKRLGHAAGINHGRQILDEMVREAEQKLFLMATQMEAGHA